MQQTWIFSLSQKKRCTRPDTRSSIPSSNFSEGGSFFYLQLWWFYFMLATIFYTKTITLKNNFNSYSITFRKVNVNVTRMSTSNIHNHLKGHGWFSVGLGSFHANLLHDDFLIKPKKFAYNGQCKKKPSPVSAFKKNVLRKVWNKVKRRLMPRLSLGWPKNCTNNSSWHDKTLKW